jgi:hypothetical protein
MNPRVPLVILCIIGGMTFVADPKKPVGGHVLVNSSYKNTTYD